MTKNNVRIVMHDQGRGEVFIDGNKVGGVKDVEFSTGVNKQNLVKLTFNSESVAIDGVVDISHIGSEFKEFAADTNLVLLKKLADLGAEQLGILNSVLRTLQMRNTRAS